MASSPQLVIAKASLTAALLRPDPTPCSRDEIENLHVLLKSAVDQCSPDNVQKCKKWMLQHIAKSSARVAALGKFLVPWATSFVDCEHHHRHIKPAPAPAGAASVPAPKKPSAKRSRLHLLYIIGDVLYHTRVRDKDDAFATGLEPTLPALFGSAASFVNSPDHVKRLYDLVSVWEQMGHLGSPALPAKLREAIAAGPAAAATSRGADAAGQKGKGKVGGAPAPAKEPPFLLPSTHGDPSTAWYDLPAATWLPVLKPNSTRAVDPARIKPLQLTPGAADAELVDAVKSLLADINRLYAPDVGVIGFADEENPSVTVNQLGERVELDKSTGEILSGTTYYGWSREFCRNMKGRRKQGSAGGGGDGDGPRGRSRDSRVGFHGTHSRSRSRDSRIGFHGTRSRSRGNHRDRGGSHALARERSAERDRGGDGNRGRSSSRPVFKRRRLSPSHSRSRSRGRGGIGRSRSRSYSPDRYRRRSGSRSRSRSRKRDHGRISRSPGYSPPPAAPVGPSAPPFMGMPPNMPPNAQFPPVPFLPPLPHMMPPIPMPPHIPGHAFGAYPPKPPFQPHSGQWPATVPAPPPSHGLPQPPMGSPMQGQAWLPPRPDPPSGWGGAWGAQPQKPPPQSPVGSPPAPHHHQPQQQRGYHHQYGRGRGTGGYRGQSSSGRGGGYNSGRGRGW